MNLLQAFTFYTMLQAQPCRFEPARIISGTVIAHKHGKPYPFTSKCGTSESKMIIEWYDEYGKEYRYISYPFSNFTKCFEFNAVIPCTQIPEGAEVVCATESHSKSPGRGRNIWCEVR